MRRVWCLAQPGLLAFTGQCSVHRGQLMRVHGAWPEALEEFAAAIERYRRAGSLTAVGLAECERGDLLRQRGELDAAEWWLPATWTRPAPSPPGWRRWPRRIGTEALQAQVALASGAVELASGDASGALPYLRKSRQLWSHTQRPYEGARVRVETARALTALGDEASARREPAAACAIFRELGATPPPRRQSACCGPHVTQPGSPRGRSKCFA